MTMTFLHEQALKIAISIMYLNEGMGVTYEQVKAVDWLRNTSETGIELYLSMAETRGYIRYNAAQLYKANKSLVTKLQDIYF